MGIRFEYGSRRATNGPMIFFTDPISEVNLKEEIRGAIESRLCFYAYHMPGDMMMTFGSSEGFVEGLGEPGFVIAPFYPEGRWLTIPYAPVPRSGAQEEYAFPEISTTPEAHRIEVEKIIRFLEGGCEGDEEGDDSALQLHPGKIVAARVSVGDKTVSPEETFLNLVRAYPNAYCFCFSTPQTGCWIGATPELLLESTGPTLSTMALAGTRQADSQGEWDEKNREEQQMVTDHIVSTLQNHDCPVKVSEPFTRKAGGIEHICTAISAKPSASVKTARGLAALLSDLSPTPATAGHPRHQALRLIKETENFSRAYYGGFCGPFRSAEDFTFFVILRCARIEARRYALFAGGGITVKSDPETEWTETSLKLRTLESMLTSEEPSSMMEPFDFDNQ